MLPRLQDCSLYRQLVVPMIIVGIIGVVATIYSAVVLEDSVEALSELYVAGDETLRTLEELDKSVAAFRAQGLAHLASESAADMGAIRGELRRIGAEFEAQLDALDAQSRPAGDGPADAYGRLRGLIAAYLGRIREALVLSADFEKELAFEIMTEAENAYVAEIGGSIQRLIHEEFQRIDVSRRVLAAAAERNLHTTIALGIGGGGLLLAIAFIVTRRITRRLSRLLDWSHTVSAGDLAAPLVCDSNDEVGRLTNAMGSMARNIARAHGDLAHAKREAEAVAETLRIYANAFESSGEAILISDRDNRIINVNAAFTEQTGYSREDVLGRNPKILASGRTPAEVFEEMWQGLNREGFWQGELWDRKKSGQIYPKWAAISAVRNDQGELLFYIASFSDISERKEAEERIEHLAHHDILTGLLNRFSLGERLEQVLVLARRERQQAAVLFIDLDRFKNINDSLGHQVGDALLVEVAKRLKDCVRESDIVARIGGDEFVVVLTGLREGSHAAEVAEKILERVGQPYCIDGHELETSPSVGIGIFPTDAASADELMKSADMAMYHAKERGRNNYYFFTESMLVAARERLELEHELRIALDHGQFELHYQPQIASGDGRVSGVEALVRWRHPVHGLVSPAKFIPLAEETGVIEPLGAWVLDEACRQLAAWKAAGVGTLVMAVNLSARQLQSEALARVVGETIQAHGIEGEELELEITETAAMHNPEQAEQQLRALRELGVALAIDDFGTGYSSLAYLKRLPIQTLKLDRTFVGDIENDPNDAEISAATIMLAHNLGLQVVAEGVETEAQRDFLVTYSCDYLQGYLYSRPLPADEATRFLSARSAGGELGGVSGLSASRRPVPTGQ